MKHSLEAGEKNTKKELKIREESRKPEVSMIKSHIYKTAIQPGIFTK